MKQHRHHGPRSPRGNPNHTERTGHPPGLLQDDCRAITRAAAAMADAQEQ